MTKLILIFDDSNVIRARCRSILEKAGYACVEAWDAAQARARLKNFDIGSVLCDLDLPDMSGLDLVDVIRTDPFLAGLPVAIVTAEWNLELFQRATRAGVKHWLLKPFKPEALIEVVAKYTAC